MTVLQFSLYFFKEQNILYTWWYSTIVSRKDVGKELLFNCILNAKIISKVFLHCWYHFVKFKSNTIFKNVLFVIWNEDSFNSFGKYLLSIYYMPGIFWVLRMRGEKVDIVPTFLLPKAYVLFWIIYIKKIHKTAIKCYKVSDVTESRMKSLGIPYYMSSIPRCTLFYILTSLKSATSYNVVIPGSNRDGVATASRCAPKFMEWVPGGEKKMGKQWWRQLFKDSWWFKTQ